MSIILFLLRVGFMIALLNIFNGILSGHVKTWGGGRQKVKAEFRVLKLSPLRLRRKKKKKSGSFPCVSWWELEGRGSARKQCSLTLHPICMLIPKHQALVHRPHSEFNRDNLEALSCSLTLNMCLFIGRDSTTPFTYRDNRASLIGDSVVCFPHVIRHSSQ